MKPNHFLLVFALVLTGCTTTPTTQIQAFSVSTKAVTQRVDAVFNDYNDALLTRSLTDYAATYSGDHAGELTSSLLAEIAPPIDDATKKRFAIYRANRAIGLYAQALSDLAVAASSAELDSAAVKLYGAMNSLNDQYREASDNHTQLFSQDDLEHANQLFSAIGVLALEKKRNDAIKNIVILADPKISILCDVIDKQLEDSGVLDGIVAARRNILVEELKDYKSQAKKESSLDWRFAKMERLYLLNRDLNGAGLLIDNAQKSIREVKVSHSILANELKNNRFNSRAIAEAVGRLKMLKNQFDDFDSAQNKSKKTKNNSENENSCAD